MSFGPHLLVCGYGCDKAPLADIDTIYSLVDGLPNAVGMTKITQTQAFRYQGKVPEDWGITASVMIAESHISIHSFVDKEFFAFDLFSCRDFDTNKVVAILQETFNPQKLDVETIIRGHEFPR